MKRVVTGICVFISIIGFSMLGYDSQLPDMSKNTQETYAVNVIGLAVFLAFGGLAVLVKRIR